MKRPIRLAAWGLGLASATALILSQLPTPFAPAGASAAHPAAAIRRVRLIYTPGGATTRTETIRWPGNRGLTVITWSWTSDKGAEPPVWAAQELRSALVQQRLLATAMQQMWQQSAPLPLFRVTWEPIPLLVSPVPLASPRVQTGHKEPRPAATLPAPRRTLAL